MSKFNFDPDFFRRVISKCEKTEKITSLTWMLKTAVEVFYEEYDYYPDLAVYAPGTFTIMGDHLEYVKGNLVQAALPQGAVVVGKSLCSIKCKVITTSKHVEGLRKSVFPISHYKKNLKVFPEWVNYIKGVINFFPHQDIRGFDAVIHSNVPFNQGYGSSAALQVGFYTFLEAVTGQKSCKKKVEKGKLCVMSEAQISLCEKKLGRWNNFTSSLAEGSTGVKVNCRTNEASTFYMKDINILFLLIYPNFEIERKDRDLICWRKMELHLAAKLLGLEEIIDATEYHLSVLENMEDPTKDTVREILRDFGKSEECINEFIEDLFYFPNIEMYPDDGLEELDGEFLEFELKPEYSQSEVTSEKMDEQFVDNEKAKKEVPRFGLKTSLNQGKSTKVPMPCLPPAAEQKGFPKSEPKTEPVSYLNQRIAELCAGKEDSQTNFPKRVCEEINCLGGLENLSDASDMSVCGKLLRRVRHIVSENTRSLTLSDLTSQLDYEEFGVKLIQSHLSLKLDFDVSCSTLDGLVQLAIDADKVYGAKMTSGGGTLTLLHRSVVEKFIEKVIEKFGDDFQFYLVFPSPGAKILSMGSKKNPKSNLSDSFLNRDELLMKAVANFDATYKYRPTHGAFSPGVINLIGDHTDYNHGFSISVGSNMLTVVVGAINGTSKIRVATTADVGDEKEKVIFSVPEYETLEPGKIKWAKLIKGVIAHFQGFVKGFDCLIQSAVPCGTVISSKSALVMAFYTFLEVISEAKSISCAGKAHRCMLAVQEFTKTVCGVGDFLVAGKTKENFVVYVDSWTTTTTLIPFQDPSVTLLLTLMNTEMNPEQNKNRKLLFARLEECYQVAKALGGKSLRCLTLKDLDALKFAKKQVPEASIRRAVHVITENERVLKAAEALKNNDFDVLGELMVASHNSLSHPWTENHREEGMKIIIFYCRDNYEITTPEIDNLVTTAMEVDGVFGSKMPYCGFVNGTLSLVKHWATDDLIEYLQKNSPQKLTFYILSSYDGCNALKVKECVEKLPSPQFVFEDIFPF